jgi:hypothetical protein
MRWFVVVVGEFVDDGWGRGLVVGNERGWVGVPLWVWLCKYSVSIWFMVLAMMVGMLSSVSGF